jgi:hypothetical protein
MAESKVVSRVVRFRSIDALEHSRWPEPVPEPRQNRRRCYDHRATEYSPPGSASCAESVAEATDPPNLIWLIPAKEAGLSKLDAVPESGTAFLIPGDDRTPKVSLMEKGCPQ